MKVDIFIVGEQKCGTTALHKFLTQHPQIKSGKQKEIDFFSYDGLYNKGIDYYHSLFTCSLYEKYVKKIKLIDASPSYLSSGEKTASRIYDYNKDAYIIIMLRNPIERAFSAYMMYKNRFKESNVNWWFEWKRKRGEDVSNVKRRSLESYTNFDTFIEEELVMLKNNNEIECPTLLNGFYYKKILNYLKLFNNVYIVENKKLSNKTETTLNQIEKYLNVKPYNWSQLTNNKIFVGNYDETIKRETQDKLKAFYEKDVVKIKNKLNIDLF
ncbi:sulfotransferase [Flavobacterium sp. CS20]|uniref:sulfotransferase family protein n=1 Tax=Flavobacterium sp. CS20 TaxID=2775246 RepID=UPI001B39EFF5|nr:sulfotransferase [Flavobacterium sp. CS20]QTY27700.1 sulfotransferase [Flavobacterium sp. CS20]